VNSQKDLWTKRYAYLVAQLRWYLRDRRRMAPDGLPFPPPNLAVLVTGSFDLDYFYENGLMGAESVRRALERNGLDVHAFRQILDFGCGCGRIIRHWSKIEGPRFYGVDYNPRLIEWCRRFLHFAEFQTNRLTPGLPYEDGSFDFVYAYSVFTHLSETLQILWINELKRILQPGGILLITVHGRSRFAQLTPDEIEQFERGHLVVRREHLSGTNLCSTYHPEPYVRQELAKDFVVIDFIPGGALDGNQDIYLLQNPIG